MPCNAIQHSNQEMVALAAGRAARRAGGTIRSQRIAAGRAVAESIKLEGGLFGSQSDAKKRESDRESYGSDSNEKEEADEDDSEQCIEPKPPITASDLEEVLKEIP
jgi:hypothetical protein